MKRLIAVVTLLVAASLALTGCGSAGGSQTLAPQQWIAEAGKQGVNVVDVRTPAEYAAGHVKGAINIDVEGSTFNDKIAKLDKNAAYALYCHSGRRSGLAADAMTKAGFTRVINLKGGLADLQGAGAATVTGE